MQIFIVTVIALAAVLIAARFIGKGQERVLDQFEVLEKRFGLALRTHRSRWGKGLFERYSLEGAFRGYPITIYSHFKKSDNSKQEWTSMVVEVLFAEDFEFDIEFNGTSSVAKFEAAELNEVVDVGQGIDFRANVSDVNQMLSEMLLTKLDSFSKKPECGAFRLIKGFIEYRESGLMTREAMRIRYQEALVLLADFADAISIFMIDRKKRMPEIR